MRRPRDYFFGILLDQKAGRITAEEAQRRWAEALKRDDEEREAFYETMKSMLPEPPPETKP
jgi:hypothetical protein